MPTKTEYVEGTPNWVDAQTIDQYPSVCWRSHTDGGSAPD